MLVQPQCRSLRGRAYLLSLILLFCCQFGLLGQDNTPPVFTDCPASVNPLTTSSTTCSVVVPDYTGQVAVTDDTTPAADLILLQTPAPGTQLSPGTEVITITATDAAGNESDCSFDLAVQSTVSNLACIASINVTLEEDCTDTVLPSMVLTGAGNCLSDFNFEILIEDGDESNGNQVDGCGTYRYLVTEVVLPGGPDITNFTGCWGYVQAEDKTAPALVSLPTPPALLYCDAIAEIAVNQLPASVSRCYRADGQTGQPLMPNFLNSALGQRLQAGGGLPVFFDGCSDVEICVNDFISNSGSCQNRTITRNFTVTDGDCDSPTGYENDPLIASYVITTTRPDLDQVTGGPASVEYSCNQFSFSDPNPQPQLTDFPSVPGPNGPVYLDETLCNVGAIFVDGPRITTCANTYKFVRTFTVIDWCQGNTQRIFTQLVKVGDFTDPVLTAPTQDLNFDGIPDSGPLFFTTNSGNCSSFFAVPAPGVSDNCDPNVILNARVFPDRDTLAIPFGPYNVNSVAGPIPSGIHLLRYVATDACGNSTSVDVEIEIGDRTAPVAICENGLNISLNNQGTGILTAQTANQASSDDCGPVSLAIARADANDNPIGQFVPALNLDCNDLGILRVILRVTDGSQNSTNCWLDVLIEDKTAPVCVPPAPLSFTCSDLDENFPQDLNLAFATDPQGTIALLNARFGLPTALDNCDGTSLSQSVFDNRNSCGVGNIQRTFSVTDAQGLVSLGNCAQFINVIGEHDYSIVFPADVENSDCVEPDYNGVITQADGCDEFTIAVDIDTFVATADECYKLRITYEVLNWCEYGTLSSPYNVPRDADNDGILNEVVVVHVLPNNRNTLTDDVAQLDRDLIRGNFNEIGNLDTGDGGVVPGADVAGYGQDRKRGAFRYQQFIKIYDDLAPTITPATLLVQSGDIDGDCLADATVDFSIDDDCTSLAIGATFQVDQFINPGPDGIYTLSDFVNDGGSINSSLTQPTPGNFRLLLEDLPFGRHAVRLRATDGCGNAAFQLVEIEIFDDKAPTPLCINGLTATLMPDGNGGGMAAIWANDFVVSGISDCSGPVKFAIYLDEDASQPGFVPNPIDTGLLLDCDLLGPQVVRIYAIDATGLAGFCQTSLLVQANQPGICTNGSDAGSLAGSIVTPGLDPMSGVTIELAGTMVESDQTNAGGQYLFQDLPLGEDYSLTPDYNPEVNLSTVSTADIILISRHILGLDLFTSDFQHLAADVTIDGNVNILDIIAIRRVILDLDQSFANTNSWRFYDPENLLEVTTINNLGGNENGLDFTAIEMGNVTGAVPLGDGDYQNGNTDGRNRGKLLVTDQNLVAGNNYSVTISTETLVGWQGSLEAGSELQMIELNGELAKAGNFNLHHLASGLIGFSYDGPAGELFTLRFKARTDGRLSDFLSVSDRILPAESYSASGEVLDLGLEWTADFGDEMAGDFSLSQNSPNPVSERTTINFTSPIGGQARLEVRSIDGRLLLQRTLEARSGYNQFDIRRDELKGATGVLLYSLSIGEFSASRKMVVL
ncbi:hypothetical protein CEQ90_04335 [Lewinellaceae bacterium SD302]|nr:hypothetical protein CEQ90_04335 [Lewinellaceae bacterium SD302]